MQSGTLFPQTNLLNLFVVLQLVGGASKVFTPSTITAASKPTPSPPALPSLTPRTTEGDTVTFIFSTGNHTVTQSSFTQPCSQLVNATTNAQGFNSGFQPVPANATSDPAWTVEVTDAASPIWFFCAQVGSLSPEIVLLD